MSSFARLHPRLQTAIVHRLGWTSLRPVQDLATEALLDGKNAVVLAPTAGGKTEASMFPALSTLLSHPPQGVGVLYIAPIKALLNNQAERLEHYATMVGLRRMVWHGDVPTAARNAFLRDPFELLMTTPESLEVMHVSTKVDVGAVFGDLRMVVVDEVHALAGTDRGAHLMSIIERLAARSRHDVQRVGLSATVGNPAAIAAWLTGSSAREAVVIDPPHGRQARRLLVLHRDDTALLAQDAAKMAQGKKSLFFCESRKTTEAVSRAMSRFGTQMFVHHSAISAAERALAEAMFHRGADACIACTSTLELGIDVGDLDLVLQHEVPATVSSFMQRMGRTGRRDGAVANTTFYCESDEAVWVSLAMVRLARAGWVEDVEVQTRCWPMLVHQLLALALERNGIAPDEAWALLSRVPDVRGITRAEFDRLVHWMRRETALELFDGLLVLGLRAEKKFAKRNFLELYAVFSSPLSYAVRTASDAPLGTLEQDFVDRLVEGISVFRLGGRGWTVTRIDHNKRVVQVTGGVGGAAPTWSGFGTRFYGYEVSQAVRALLLDEGPEKIAHETAQQVLDESRARFAPIFANGDVELTEKGLTWWTFAGGRVNATLKYAFGALRPDWKVVGSNFSLRFDGEGVTERAYHDALLEIADLEFWENERLWLEVAESLPDYRLSKFQQFMPPWVQQEMVASHLLDIEHAAEWLVGTAAAAPAWRGLAPAEDPPAVVRADATQDGEAGDESAPGDRAAIAKPQNPFTWVDTDAGLVEVATALREHPRVALDVETTLRDRHLCLVQIATRDHTWLCDTLAIEDLAPLGELLSDPKVEVLIHNAQFERSVLGKYGIEITAVVDTLTLSRAHRAEWTRHRLLDVCERELGLRLDKRHQTSNWAMRPLSVAQLDYAALDAEVLFAVADALTAW